MNLFNEIGTRVVEKSALPVQDDGKVHIAVYDFDGTCITGNSPVMLVRHLIRKRKIGLWTAIRIGAWATAYKLSLPQNESWVRWLVFKAFDGTDKVEVDNYLAKFYEDHVARRFRPEADLSMANMVEQGFEVIVVSATWDAIVKQASKTHPFQDCLGVRMQVDPWGNYTRFVDGEPLEGQAKVDALVAFADARYGQGNWILDYAFGDHHSDLPLLEYAEHPCAVTPDRPLRRAAKGRDWPILEWCSVKQYAKHAGA